MVVKNKGFTAHAMLPKVQQNDHKQGLGKNPVYGTLKTLWFLLKKGIKKT